MLNRVIEWTETGINYEADQRHAEIIIEQVGEQAKGKLTTPGRKLGAEEREKMNVNVLTGIRATKYRALTARANYLSQDRSDIRFAVKELCRKMSG